jgi:hypothetical protein
MVEDLPHEWVITEAAAGHRRSPARISDLTIVRAIHGKSTRACHRCVGEARWRYSLRIRADHIHCRRQLIPIRAASWRLTCQIVDLGGSPFGSNAAYRINTQGQIAGITSDATANHAVIWPTHAALWAGETVYDLGALSSCGYSAARQISNTELVVGEGWVRNPIAHACDTHAFFWDASGTLTDLGTLGMGTSSTAYDVNDAGQIVGSSPRTATSATQTVATLP